jgi:hypothetical protein
VIVVVADASPLIALEGIGQLELLKALFEEVLIPPAVAGEVAPGSWGCWFSRRREGSSPLCGRRSRRCSVSGSGRILTSSSAFFGEPGRA